MYSCLYYVFRSRFGSSALCHSTAGIVKVAARCASSFASELLPVCHGQLKRPIGAGAGAVASSAGAAGCAGGADRGADVSDLGAGGSDRGAGGAYRGAGGAYRGGGGGAGSSAHSPCGRAMVADPALELRHGLFINKLKVKSIKHIINNSFLSNTKFEIKHVKTSNNKNII